MVTRDYIRGFDRAIGGGSPIIGVVKSSPSRRVVNAAEATLPGDVSVAWPQDNALMSQLFGHEVGNEIRWTPWMEEVSYQTDIGDGHEVSIVGDLDTTFDQRQYRRCFFFVRLPDPETGGSGTVLRIETLRGMIGGPERSTDIQNLVLSELARTRDVPEAILKADRYARISRDQRRKLLADVGLSSLRDYDRDHRSFTGNGGD